MDGVPDGAQLSEDGHYWWDGSQWQLVPTQSTSGSGTTQVGTRSEDGHYWWDGSQWQPVDQAQSQSQTGGGGHDQPMDWSQFPELARALQYGQEVDTYLQDLGVDPHLIQDDEPFANA
ncbi:MAG TPA: hypothetical protein VH333_13910 [Pseudonocardiaceae bacterium]|nr:hypothetical protein [Pseudonocardiaceae bacterium]